jgi:predicted amidohydrolase
VGERIIAAAQSISIAGDIAANIQRHLCFMQAAMAHRVEFLLFPELSLTGYECARARELAIDPVDARLQPLRDLAHDSGMITVVGASVRQPDSDEVLIAALVFGADGTLGVYTKQYLHVGEELVFSPGKGGANVRIDTDHIELAVCADFAQAMHARQAAQSGAKLYAASVLITEGGYAADTQLLSSYAAEHHMAVLMANHGGATGGWASAGRSAFWSECGALVGATRGGGDQLLIASRDSQGWSTRVMPVVA